MPWTVNVLEPLRDLYRAFSIKPEMQQTNGVQLVQGYVFGQFKFPLVLFEIRNLHAFDGEGKVLSRQQALFQVIPVAKVHEWFHRFVDSEFPPECSFGPLGQVAGGPGGLEIHARCFSFRPGVEFQKGSEILVNSHYAI